MRVQVTFMDGVRIVVNALDNYSGEEGTIRLCVRDVKPSKGMELEKFFENYTACVCCNVSRYSDYVNVVAEVMYTEIKQVEFIP